DSEALAGVLESAGYQKTDDPKQADILLVNACVVRQNAEDKAAWYVTSAKGLRKTKPNLIIGLCGCIVTEPGRDIKTDFPHVDLFIPPNQPGKLEEFMTSLPHSPSTSGRGGQDLRANGGEGITKYITIMHGCDNFCSYCVVPHVRGRESSRPVEEILDEIKKVDFNQYKEIFLLGQNVNSYKYGLANLLREIEKLTPSPHHSPLRTRFMTSHPKDMSDEIIQAVADLPHVCEYFHLPIQHGDDEILKSMNRGYNVDYYRKLVAKIRAKMQGAAITSDIIVGYPGESDRQFQNSLNIIREISFDACNTAAYSTRPGTAAAKLEDSVPQKLKQERLQEIMKVVDEVTLANNDKLVGTSQEILVDREDGGRTRTNKIVKFSQPNKGLLGQLVGVRIKSAKSWVLEGDIING
ncbi:MAG: tRNA (N6-isopentenyl adenosine(37)-C2)-methylthiotransferase MiaB, partial [Candidatus Margulisbacteria bacterium]|nr:tRNA (N6-isopentenyl adenosine(37)-C2)-methylthiotransferase MiaB [Candidatus Margulisiibacteriota bacterium]